MNSEGGWWRGLHKDVSVLNATELNFNPSVWGAEADRSLEFESSLV